MKKAAPMLIVIAGILWGIMGIFVRKLGEYGFDSIQIASLRIIGGALIFLLIGIVGNRQAYRIRLRDIPWFIGMGIGSLLMFTVCYFTTIRLASLSVAAILLYTEPIMVMLMSLFIFKEKMTWRKMIAVIFAFAGCVLITGIGGAKNVSLQAIGIGLLSAFGYGMYSILGTFVLRKYQPLIVTTYTFVFGSIGAFIVCRPFQIIHIIHESENGIWLVVFILITAFVTAVLPYLFYTIGLSYVKASSAAIMASVEPVVATVAGALVFGEMLTISAVAGIILVLCAIIIINLSNK